MTTTNTTESAPFGVHPVLGTPYSEKSKNVAGILQILAPVGTGRLYSGHTWIAFWQFVVTILTFGFGGIWSFLDGIRMLTGNPTDKEGHLLR